MPSYAIALKLVGEGEVEAGTKRVNKGFLGLENTVSKFQKKNIQTRDGLRDLREELSHFGGKFGDVFPAFQNLAGLLGGGLVAGIAELGRNFANTGTEIANTSNRIGIGVKALQSWRKAADLAGDSADDATNAFRGIGANLYAAERGEQSGINAELVSRKYGVTFGRGKEEQTLRDLNRIFNTNPLLKNNPQKAQAVETAITGSDNLYDLLSKPTADFTRIMKEAGNTPGISDQQAKDAQRAHEAFVGLTQAVTQLGLNLGAFTDRWLVPLETAMTKIINAVNKSPVASNAIGVGTTAVAGGAIASLFAKAARFAGVLPKGFKLPFGPVAGAIFALEEGFELYKRFPKTDNETWMKEARKDKSDQVNDLLRQNLERMNRLWDTLQNIFSNPWGWLTGGGGAGGAGGGKPAGPLDPKREAYALDRFQKELNLTKAQAAGLVADLEQESRLDPTAQNSTGHVGIAQWDPTRAAGLNGSTNYEDQVSYVIKELKTTYAAALSAIKATTTAADAATAGQKYYEIGGDYQGRGVARANEIYNSSSVADKSAPPTAVPAPAAPSVASKAAPPAAVPAPAAPGKPADLILPDVRVVAPAPAASGAPPAPASPPAPATLPVPGKQGRLIPIPPRYGTAENDNRKLASADANSRHEFHLRISGAPAGTRGEMVVAEGPAVASVKTSFALEGV